VHELSFAMSLVEMATAEAARRGARVLAAHVKLGALSGVVKEALLSSYEAASAGTPLEGSALVIEEVPAVIHCGVCREDRATRQYDWFTCEVCGATTTDLIRGRELELSALELE
jgi:hydrogenase nickel incorporation protein HypA/HybF